MSTGVDCDSVTESLARLHAEIDALLTANIAAEPNATVLESLRECERLRRRLDAVDHRLVAAAERRGLGQAAGHRGTASLLVDLLRLSRRDATGRVRAAEGCGPRVALTGEVLPPLHPRVAAAQADGSVSGQQARIITGTLNRLPGHVTVEAADAIGDALLTLATVAGPEQVGTAARHALVVTEQDCAPAEADERRRERRGFTLHSRPDGTARISGELDAECAEAMQTVLDPLAAPRPAAAGVPDQRSAAQRRHDGLLDAVKLLLRAEQLPDCGGVATTVLILIDHDAWLTGYGYATLGHGGIITARQATEMAGGDATVIAAALNSLGAVTALSGDHRLFTPRERRAMTARDRGCTFPACTAPPAWCEAHHVTDYATTGRTSVNDGALVCGYDHRQRIRHGWTTTMINGRPYWKPPKWIDPDQTPVRNTIHDPPQPTLP